MKLLNWVKVNRKRRNDLSHTDKEYVRGYDIDMPDFTLLVSKYNAEDITRIEENQLMDYILTMLNIVLENPRINPKQDELDSLSDQMFIDMWGAMKYIRNGTKPYSYIYRSGYTAACRYYKKIISDRAKKQAIEEHVNEVFMEYMDEVDDHKVYTSEMH